MQAMRRRGPGRAGAVLTDEDIHLFNEGTHARAYLKLGSHPATRDGEDGTAFAVWAPGAARVSVVGDFNGWSPDRHPLRLRGQSGVFEGFVAGLGPGAVYKYHVASRLRGYEVDKADPFAFRHETPPRTGSVVWDLDYSWGDRDWMSGRSARHLLSAASSTYEVHLGSWRRDPGQPDRFLTYRELAPALADYVEETGFTHVEVLPVMEHPFYGSWGYQSLGYFAPTSRQGTPQDLMHLVDTLHQRGIGVIFDWVPSHFPTDEHGLAYFDGTHLYEHADRRQGHHPDWDSFIFNYGRHEVRSFLLSSAMFWLDVFHADGLRVDAVASMLYLDYSRQAGEWVPNAHGGRENLEAISFLRRLNEDVYREHPDVQTVAEESTAWPMVSRPLYVGGLGFGLKWDMGWMHDTLAYFARDPVHRKFHHNELTFRTMYAFTENFVLPLSHDEVVHGKGSLLGKMPGDEWQKLANLRLLFGWMWAQPGKKLLFMGGEIGQWREWSHDRGLDWHLLEHAPHRGLQAWVRDLNRLYRSEPALHERDCEPGGFEWVDCNDSEASVLSFLRRGRRPEDVVLVACNFTPQPQPGYRVGVPEGGHWRELLNSDATVYGGAGWGNMGGLDAEPAPHHGRPLSLPLTLPPLGAVFLKPDGLRDISPRPGPPAGPGSRG
jgi:1,4-alpha-glucan branching enzyme